MFAAQLFVLLTLLDTDGFPFLTSLEPIRDLKQTYLRFLHRKLKAANCSFSDYATFRKALTKVKVFATLMDLFL